MNWRRITQIEWRGRTADMRWRVWCLVGDNAVSRLQVRRLKSLTGRRQVRGVDFACRQNSLAVSFHRFPDVASPPPVFGFRVVALAYSGAKSSSRVSIAAEK